MLKALPTTRTQKAVFDLKVPPHSISAEQSVLGGLMLDNGAWDLIADRIQENDFYRHEHKVIFSTVLLLEQRSQPFDIITLSDTLKSLSKLEEAGGEAYLFEISSKTPSVANIAAYADIVYKHSLMRQLLATTAEIADKVYTEGEEDPSFILDTAEQKIFNIGKNQRGSGLQDIKTFLSETTKRMTALADSKSSISGLSTGFKELDVITAGLQPSELIILAGRPSMGKTALAMNIAENVLIKTNKSVFIFSMEMSGDNIAMRMLSSLGEIPFQKLKTGQFDELEWRRISIVNKILSGKSLFIDDTPALTPLELRARARRAVKEKGLPALIVIDYLQLMRSNSKTENRTIEITEISRSLKALAKELSVPIIVLSQLNRALEQRADRRPIMSDLRDSGAIEQDADVIAFIYRDEVYNLNTIDKGIAELIIAKQRNGETGRIKLGFQGKYTKFQNYI